MFDIFSKNSPGRVLVKYANDIGYLYKNLEKIEGLNYDDARKKRTSCILSISGYTIQFDNFYRFAANLCKK